MAPAHKRADDVGIRSDAQHNGPSRRDDQRWIERYIRSVIVGGDVVIGPIALLCGRARFHR